MKFASFHWDRIGSQAPGDFRPAVPDNTLILYSFLPGGARGRGAFCWVYRRFFCEPPCRFDGKSGVLQFFYGCLQCSAYPFSALDFVFQIPLSAEQRTFHWRAVTKLIIHRRSAGQSCKKAESRSADRTGSHIIILFP